jgi:hypothetical protein
MPDRERKRSKHSTFFVHNHPSPSWTTMRCAQGALTVLKKQRFPLAGVLAANPLTTRDNPSQQSSVGSRSFERVEPLQKIVYQSL